MNRLLTLSLFLSIGYILNGVQGMGQSTVIWISIVTLKNMFLTNEDWFTHDHN